MMETKRCLGCGNQFERNYTFNNFANREMLIPTKTWLNKKYCSDNCGYTFRYKKNVHKIGEYQKKYQMTVTKEKRRKYYLNRKPKIKDYMFKLKKEKPEQYQRLLNASKNWRNKLKQKIFDLYEHKCAICGFKDVLDIHHVDEGEKRYKNDYKNAKRLILLCPNHHHMFHRGKLSKENITKHLKRGENEK